MRTEEEPFVQPRCPRCGSLDIHFQSIHERLGMASVLTFIPIPIPKRAWICADCDAEWRDNADGTEGAHKRTQEVAIAKRKPTLFNC